MNSNWVCEANRLWGEISDLEEADLMMDFYLVSNVGKLASIGGGREERGWCQVVENEAKVNENGNFFGGN
jgi:hypothetical protein